METPDATRELLRQATAGVIEVALQHLSLQDRIDVLGKAWERTVYPALMNEAREKVARTQVVAFRVPYPVDVRT